MTNHLPDMIYDDNLYLEIIAICGSNIEYVIRTHCFDVSTLL